MANKRHLCKGCSEYIKKTEYCIKCFGSCERWFHRKCSQLSNQEFSDFDKGLTKEKWICVSCSVQESPLGEEDEDGTLKLRSGKQHNKEQPSLDSIMVMLRKMNTKLEKFEESVVFNGEILSEVQNTLKGIKVENKELKRENLSLRARISELEREVSNMRGNFNKEEYQEKRNNVVIVGLENESIQESVEDVIKICETLDVQIQEQDIDCKILSNRDGKKQLLVKFKEVKDRDMMVQKRKGRKLTLEECKIGDKIGNIYINEDLPSNIRRLYRKARELKKNGYKFVWQRNGHIFARKSNNTDAREIFSESQVDQMIQEQKE